MKIGIVYANLAYRTPDSLEAMATAAEEAGVESVWAEEHPAIPAHPELPTVLDADPNGAGSSGPLLQAVPFPDPLVWLAHVGALTRTVKLGTGVLVLPLHNPVLLARRAATLNQTSNGRFILGVGLGWHQEEFDAVGVPFDDRAERAEDYVGALRGAWSEEGSYQGSHVRFSRIRGGPKPATGEIPIHIGASKPRGARRAGRLADGFFPMPFESSAMMLRGIAATVTGERPDWSGQRLPAEVGQLIDACRKAAVDEGRSAESIEITVAGPAVLDMVEQANDLGAIRYLVMPPTVELSEIPSAFRRLSETLISPST